MSLGNTAASLGNLPGAPVVVNYAPQLDLLSRAALTITHAGTNTTLAALSFGVPLVAVPISHDQPATAARIAFSGAGEVVSPASLTPGRLRTAVQRVIAEPSYRTNAQRIQKVIAQAGGVRRAADLVEEVAVRKGRGAS